MALIWFVAAVHPTMMDHVGVIGKGFPTRLTFVILFAGVYGHVTLHVGLVGEAFPTI